MIELAIYAISIVFSFYLAWGMGANDAANPTSGAVGAGAVTMKRAIILFAIFAAVGGILLGPFVMKTVDRGLVERQQLSSDTVIVGSLTAVLSAAIWVTFSTWKGMPISTSHAIVGGVIGFGIIVNSSLIKWNNFYIVLLSVIATPILSFLLAFGLYRFLRSYFQKTRSDRNNFTLVYLLIFILCFATSISVLNQVLNWGVAESFLVSFLISLVFSAVATFGFQKKYGKFETTQSLAYLVLVSLCFSALAFGANDMANATGVFVTPTEKIMGRPTLEIMFLLAIVGAAGIAAGAFTWGYKVINVAAYQVTRLNTLSGAAAGYSSAITVFLFTVVPNALIGFGIPISTTHSAVGAIIGVGLAMRGSAGIDRRITGKILTFWVLTIPAVILLSMALFWLFSHVLVIV